MTYHCLFGAGNGTLVRYFFAGNKPENSTFPGTVRTDEPCPVPGQDLKAGIAEQNAGAVLTGDMYKVDHDFPNEYVVDSGRVSLCEADTLALIRTNVHPFVDGGARLDSGHAGTVLPPSSKVPDSLCPLDPKGQRLSPLRLAEFKIFQIREFIISDFCCITYQKYIKNISILLNL